MYPNIINGLGDGGFADFYWVIHLKTGWKLNVLAEKLNKWTLENPCYCLKKAEAVILTQIIKVEGKKASGKTSIAQISSFAVILPHFWKKVSCFHMLLKVIIMAASLLVSSLFTSVFRSQYWINVFCSYEEFRSELLTLLHIYMRTIWGSPNCWPEKRRKEEKQSRFIVVWTKIQCENM